MTAKSTPGPWTLKPMGVIVGGKAVQYTNGSSQGQIAMATLVAGSDVDDPAVERDANARLIAAAPDMLAALQMLIGDVEMGLGLTLSERVDNAREAIAKATGDAS